ncbi:B3 domain-containing transcription factor VRN1 [Linum perenne]
MLLFNFSSSFLFLSNAVPTLIPHFLLLGPPAIPNMSYGMRPTPGFGAHIGGAHVLFCELIVSHDVQSRMLRLPKEYTRILPQRPATLTVPSSDDWEMQLFRDRDGFVWLGAGWENFYAFYRMGFGHLLMFQYTATSHFSVVIFDRTATEITYPLRRPPSPQALEDSDSVQILDGPPDEPAHVEDADYTSSVEILEGRPVDHAHFRASYSDLRLGYSDIHIVLRCVHSWFPSVPIPDIFPPLYTIWLDRLGTVFEGRTEPQHAPAVLARFTPGTLYHLKSTHMIPARTERTSCPQLLRLVISPDQDAEEIHEDVATIPFPTIAVVPSPFCSLQSRVASHSRYYDLVGCLVSITGFTQPNSVTTKFSIELRDDRYSHEHCPIRLLSTKYDTSCQYLQSPLPPVTTLFALLSAAAEFNPPYEVSHRSLIRVDAIYDKQHCVSYDEDCCRYCVQIKCSDLTHTMVVVANHNVSTSLFRILAEEFAALDPEQRDELIESIVNSYFTVEISLLPEDHTLPRNFLVSSIWHPLTITL